MLTVLSGFNSSKDGENVGKVDGVYASEWAVLQDTVEQGASMVSLRKLIPRAVAKIYPR